MRHDCFGDFVRDLVFEVQNIRKLFVKLSGPRSCFVPNVEQLNSDANVITGASDSAVENKCDAEFASRA